MNNKLDHPFGRTAKNWYLDKLPQGTIVDFNNGILKGFGIIVGIAMEGVTSIGRTYIINPLSFEHEIELEYDTFALSEVYLQIRK